MEVLDFYPDNALVLLYSSPEVLEHDSRFPMLQSRHCTDSICDLAEVGHSRGDSEPSASLMTCSFETKPHSFHSSSP